MIKDMSVVVFISSFLSSFVMLSLILVLSKVAKPYRKGKFLVATILLGLYVFFSYMITDNFIRTVLVFALLILCSMYVENFKRTNLFSFTIMAFVVWLTIMLVDISLHILLSTFLKGDIIVLFRSNGFLILLSNSIIFLVTSLIFYNKTIRRFIFKISSYQFKRFFVK